MKPKKQFGQNFLTSVPARIAIVEAGELHADDRVLEIGPGRGFLTRALLETGAHITAVEKDRDLLPILAEEFKAFQNFSLLEGDALTYEPEASGYKLIANIPYYITGAILERYLTYPKQPTLCVVLVQKEVAERVVARDGKESILSLSVKAYGNPKIVYRVSRGSFHPIPSVDSAVLQIKNISRDNFKNQYHEALFFKVVKAGFAHKRKLLLSNLKDVFPDASMETLFEEISLPKNIRAEDVTLALWIALSSKLSTLS
jgi:16S rRNA (adenine1518-N6/adenine1519-N6)-dimethyltransferase